MAGHSHAANVARRKEAVAAKRSKIFSKISKMIMIAVKLGGPDVKGNPRLSLAISKAKAVSMPRDTIEKAVKKASGESDSANMEEILYEGYGPNGVAIMCEIMTDNRNRTAPEIRKIFDTCGGNLGSTNCVSYMFQRKGQFLIPQEGRSEDDLMAIVLDAGADDLTLEDGYFEVLCDPNQFSAVAEALEKANISPEQADIVRLPSTYVQLDAETSVKMRRLLDLLDDQDDVQNVFSNAELAD